MCSATALPGCLVRRAVGSPSALGGGFSSDSPGPPRCGVSALSHGPSSVQDRPAQGAAQGHPSLPPSASPQSAPSRGSEFHAPRSAPNSQLSPRTGPKDLCVALGEPVLSRGANTASVLGRLGLDRLEDRAGSQASLKPSGRGPGCAARLCAQWPLGVALYACLRRAARGRRDLLNRYKTFKQKQGRFPSSREPPGALS